MGDEGTIPTLEDPTSFNPRRHVYRIPYPVTCDDRVVMEKIESAFRGVTSFPFRRIYFQFWRTVDDDGRLVLECYRNPYANAPFDRLLVKYRSRSIKYRYSINDNNNNNNSTHPPRIISGGLPAVAFLNHFPEVALDLRDHQGGSPLVDHALECDLTCCTMLPIFDRYSKSDQCLGVVECSMKHPSLLLPIFNEMKRELEKRGLSIYHVQGRWPYKTIPGDLEPVKIEIEEALKIASESHELTLGQVWISNGHHASDTTSHQMKRTLLVKLSGYCVDSNDGDPLSSVKDFYDKLDVVSLKEDEEGLALKTLRTHQPHLCKNIYKLSENKGVLALLSANTKCTCLVMCLRSTHTGELEYAFEFFWPRRRNHLILSEALLLTLRRSLPSFKFDSCDEIYVVDDASLWSGVKRKSIDMNQSNEHNINNPDEKDDDDDDDLAILAFYRNDGTLFFLPRSSTFENLMVKLNMEFELDPAVDYKVEHELLPGQWFILESLESCRRKIKDTDLIKLRLVAVNGEVGWLWKTNNS